MSRLNGRRAEAERDGLKVNVAILGAGNIANAMATTLNAMVRDPRYHGLVAPYAVAARSSTRAEAFAKRYGIPVSYGSYEELAADPNVDLVYIATPHSLHAEQAILCLKAGKNVLVEKSFTANAGQAQALLDTAHATGLLCTEAIWTRYMPSRGIIDGIVASGAIGEVRAARANLGYPVFGNLRLTDPALAGGALLDMGVYPLNFIDMVMGPRPIERISTAMIPYESGVDAQSSTMISYRDGTMGVADCSMVSVSERIGTLWGTEGYLICENINDVASIDVYDADHSLVKHHTVPKQLTGYEYQVASAANAILDGKGECPEMPHADTMRIMGLMDRIRSQWGLRYPFE
ncbi:Gfo/Idh/MocA family protein [Bifidobacterium sp.]|uniref:Gfo/Idh/MocA family protein n=1 Tax=Bifidobacterium sp. TaxID=41200 RepID=UPI0025BDC751|nr:Gfo/Idh/MocA family oxidoreductase [Bifidobacterium sp.]MCH4208804.1 Gfo/Idh/MocA family oxidoreductase [Bifidobacterium sp.]MCI1224762.1 Gfo/Idh/MocA family oxidoreductase [Bifidobacterium sp.]